MCLRRRSRLNVYKRVRLNARHGWMPPRSWKKSPMDATRTKNWRRRVLAQPIKAMLRMCWRVYSVNKANNALYVDGQNLPASFVQIDRPLCWACLSGSICFAICSAKARYRAELRRFHTRRHMNARSQMTLCPTTIAFCLKRSHGKR